MSIKKQIKAFKKVNKRTAKFLKKNEKHEKKMIMDLAINIYVGWYERNVKTLS